MKVFLTGGSGLLGSHVAGRLRAGGHDVVALVRPGADRSFLVGLGCECVEGDLTEAPKTHAGRMEGCKGLVHSAARMYGGASLASVSSVNVEGTRRLLGGAAEAGISQVVHISSVAVYGGLPGPITEETSLDQPLREGDFYARTKREAERVALGLHGTGTIQVTVLRLSTLFGERDRWFVPRLVSLLRRRVVPLIGSGETRFPALYAGNAARAVELALEGRASGETLNLAEDSPLSLRSLLDGLARELGSRPRFVRIPAGLARVAAALGETLGIRIPGARDLSLSRTIRLASEDNPYSSEKARTMLGWKPPFTLEEALALTGSWTREKEGWNGPG